MIGRDRVVNNDVLNLLLKDHKSSEIILRIIAKPLQFSKPLMLSIGPGSYLLEYARVDYYTTLNSGQDAHRWAARCYTTAGVVEGSYRCLALASIRLAFILSPSPALFYTLAHALPPWPRQFGWWMKLLF